MFTAVLSYNISRRSSDPDAYTLSVQPGAGQGDGVTFNNCSRSYFTAPTGRGALRKAVAEDLARCGLTYRTRGDRIVVVAA